MAALCSVDDAPGQCVEVDVGERLLVAVTAGELHEVVDESGEFFGLGDGVSDEHRPVVGGELFDPESTSTFVRTVASGVRSSCERRPRVGAVW